MTEAQVELGAEITNENLYQEWEAAIEDDNAKVAVTVQKELEERGVNMQVYFNFLPLHSKALLMSYV